MGNEAKVQLLTAKFSLFGQRVNVALVEKGIPFEVIPVNLGSKPKELLEANPIYGKIPTIIHDGKPLAESLVILEYLEDAWPGKVPLMPEDALEKAKVRFWTDYIYKGFSIVTDSLKLQPGAPELEVKKAEFVKFMKTLEETMTSYSAKGPFFTGDKFGYLDVVLCPFACTLNMVKNFLGLPLPGPDEIPRFYKWYEAVKAHPSVSSTLPTDEEVWSFLPFLIEKKVIAERLIPAAGAAK